MGTTLASWEYSCVNLALNLGVLVLAEEDETCTWSAQRLVRRGSDNVAVLERVVLYLCGNETRDVGNVAHEVGALRLCRLGEALVVPVARVGTAARDEHARLEQVGVAVQALVVEQASLGVYLVGERLKVD